MHITIINDCSDVNAAGRQMARMATLEDASVSFIGVGSYGDMAAAGNLIDVLDAHDGKPGAILVNVAPRHGTGKKWPNGTPFCYFWHKQTLVVSTFDGLTLSLVKKLCVAERVSLMDIRAVVDKMQREHLLDEEMGERIVSSQFRSYDFAPRVASYLLHENEPPATLVPLSEIDEAPRAVWWVDNFGNIKTTLLADEIGFAIGESITLAGHTLVCKKRLSDVANDEAALIIGSSGLGEQRFLEIVVQGKRACDELGLGLGDEL